MYMYVHTVTYHVRVHVLPLNFANLALTMGFFDVGMWWGHCFDVAAGFTPDMPSQYALHFACGGHWVHVWLYVYVTRA